VVGANIGKTKVVEVDDAIPDYRETTRALAPHADYIALNVSSPNTPGLRQMQTAERLGALVAGVREELRSCGRDGDVPLLVKLAPDLADKEIEGIADLAVRLELDGIVAVNTTVDNGLAVNSEAELASQEHGGGLSGRPLQERALEVLRLLHARVGDRLTLVSVGGVESHLDAWERILAGASLVQAYTAFVYGGPLWPHRLNRGLARCLRDSQWSSIGEAVGQGAVDAPRARPRTAA
jgi:dihydroorotate dehydrogenase